VIEQRHSRSRGIELSAKISCAGSDARKQFLLAETWGTELRDILTKPVIVVRFGPGLILLVDAQDLRFDVSEFLPIPFEVATNKLLGTAKPGSALDSVLFNH
jgi:hypothetical protein